MPIRDPIIRQNYESLKESIMQKNPDLQDGQFTESPTLHVTVLMLDLKDQVRFNAAKTVL